MMQYILRAIVGMWITVSFLIGMALAIGRVQSGDIIAFTRTVERNSTIILLDTQTGVRADLLTAADIPELAARSPQWSPDGDLLAFIAILPSREVAAYTWSFTSGQFTDLTDQFGYTTLPLHSPVGSQVIFVQSPISDTNTIDLYSSLVVGDDEPPQRLARGVRGYPVWSPDGTQMIYAARILDEQGERISATSNTFRDAVDLYLLDIASGQRTNLTGETLFFGEPQWSPQGGTIAFDTGRSGDGSRIVMVDLDTLTQSEIPREDGIYSDRLPRWSPDGRYIAYVSRRSDNSDIFVYDTQSGNQWAVTSHPSYDLEQTWLPDSNHILFTSGRRGRADLYRVNIHTGAIRLLTQAFDSSTESAVRP